MYLASSLLVGVLDTLNTLYGLALTANPVLCLLGFINSIEILAIVRSLLVARKLIASQWVSTNPPTVSECISEMNKYPPTVSEWISKMNKYVMLCPFLAC